MTGLKQSGAFLEIYYIIYIINHIWRIILHRDVQTCLGAKVAISNVENLDQHVLVQNWQFSLFNLDRHVLVSANGHPRGTDLYSLDRDDWRVLAHTVCLSTHCFLCNSVISIVQACTCNLDPFVTWRPFGDRDSGRCQARESSMVALTIVWAVPARINTVSVFVNILDLVRRRSVIGAPSCFPTILFLPFQYCFA